MGLTNLLITGGAGFIGSHLIGAILRKQLDANGSDTQYHIFNMDKLDYCSSLEPFKNLSSEFYTFIKGDITQVDFVNYILQSKRISVIIHAAAQSHVDNSFGDSFEFTKNNIVGTHVLLEAARVHGGITRFIHISTDEVYGECAPGEECLESTLLSPSNPYSATKAAAEHLVSAYQKSFNLPTIITRSNNIYGPGQFPEKVIPKFVCSLLKGRKCFIHGDGSNSRHYLFSSDVADALYLILQHGEIGEVYNIGGRDELTNLELARLLIELISPGSGDKYLEFTTDRPYNDRRYAVNCSKLYALGWEPKVPFEKGLMQTVEWYRSNLAQYWPEDVVHSALNPHPQLVNTLVPLQFSKGDKGEKEIDNLE